MLMVLWFTKNLKKICSLPTSMSDGGLLTCAVSSKGAP